MPQMRKGGKFVFGLSRISPDLALRIPPAALDEYGIHGGQRVIAFSGSAVSGGFCVTTPELMEGSKLAHVLEDLPDLRDGKMENGEFVPYKGRKYGWIRIGDDGVVRLTYSVMSAFGIQAGAQLLVVRSSNIAFMLAERGPLIEQARRFASAIEQF